MKELLKEFREFVSRGNVVDLAVGVIIGAAFGKIVSSLVADIIMPPLGLLLGNIDFNHLVWELKPAVDSKPDTAITLKYGVFLKNVIDFLLVAAAIFGIVKANNRIRKPAPTPPPPPVSKEVELLTEIRDALVKR
jgi:large conductance mechanosensitive channel